MEQAERRRFDRSGKGEDVKDLVEKVLSTDGIDQITGRQLLVGIITAAFISKSETNLSRDQMIVLAELMVDRIMLK